MRLLYYCIVGNPLIYRVKGCVGDTPFPQQTPPGRHPSHIQLITCLFLNRNESTMHKMQVVMMDARDTRFPLAKVHEVCSI
jgi:hypothetical protein